MTLDEFLIEIRLDLVNFENKYREKHLENPQNYPLEISNDNSGVWMEILNIYFNDRIV